MNINDIKSKNDSLKYEIAEDLGLMEKINKDGWTSLSNVETGKISGIISKKMRNARSKI